MCILHPRQECGPWDRTPRAECDLQDLISPSLSVNWYEGGSPKIVWGWPLPTYRILSRRPDENCWPPFRDYRWWLGLWMQKPSVAPSCLGRTCIQKPGIAPQQMPNMKCKWASVAAIPSPPTGGLSRWAEQLQTNLPITLPMTLSYLKTKEPHWEVSLRRAPGPVAQRALTLEKYDLDEREST